MYQHQPDPSWAMTITYCWKTDARIAGHGRIWPGDGLGLPAATRTLGGRRARTLGGGARLPRIADARSGMVMFFYFLRFKFKQQKKDSKNGDLSIKNWLKSYVLTMKNSDFVGWYDKHTYIHVDPSAFLESTWGMIWGVKYLLRRSLDP